MSVLIVVQAALNLPVGFEKGTLKKCLKISKVSKNTYFRGIRKSSEAKHRPIQELQESWCSNKLQQITGIGENKDLN